MRDPVRRVPRRPRQAPSDDRRRAHARQGVRRAATRRSAARKESRSASPGRRRMSSSSGPDPSPQLDAAGLEQVEEIEQRGRQERALGDAKRPGRRARRRLDHRRLGAPRRPLARLLPARAARLHRPRQLLDVQARGQVRLHDRLDALELRHDPAQLDVLAQHARQRLHVADRRGRLPRSSASRSRTSSRSRSRPCATRSRSS